MERLESIESLITSDAITLFWNKPEFPEGSCQYRIIQDGRVVGATDKTHYTIENLTPDTGYELQIQIINANDGTIYAASECITLQTGKQKIMLDISQEPYLAVADGKTVNTETIQKAIDDCRAHEAVYIPAGVFMTGALRLHSDMELYLEEGAVLQGTDQEEDYLPRIKSRFEGTEMECFSSVLNLGELDHNSGYNCCNVVIRGKGTIASGGRKLAETIINNERERLSDYLKELGDDILECENLDTIPGRVRPRLINMSNAQNIVLSGLTLQNGASWNVHMIYSDQIVTHNCVFRSEGVWNGDGWDPDSSSNCTIFDCTFFTGDDSIAIKSGKNPQGNEINRPCEHIRIFDCQCAYGHGIAMGSEMSGGINDISIWDCDLGNSLYGIEIKATKKRGGYVRNIRVKDCTVPRIMFHSVGYNDDGVGAETPPVFESCEFKRLRILGEYFSKERTWEPCEAVELCGFDEPGFYLKDILFSDIMISNKSVYGKQAFSIQYCQNVTFQNISSF